MSTATLSPLRSYAPIEVLERDTNGRALTVRLPNRYLAEYMRRRDDCMRACLASLAQVPYDQVPDVAAALDGGPLAEAQALADLGAWANMLGYRLTYHPTPPTDRGAWIGGVDADEHGPSHGVVMCLDRVVFDPASNFPLPPGHELVPVALADIAYGITLDPRRTS